jgi:hypothetical protein
VPHSWKGSIAGLAGSLVLAAFFLLFQASSVFVELDVITLIDRLGSIGRVGAWADHFIVGVLLWGPIFAAFDATTSERPRWQKGLMFSVFAWLAMMLIFMPVVGAGLFGLGAGVVVPVGMLILHLIFGAVLGTVFQILDERFPTKTLLPGEQHPLGGLQ